MSKLTTLITELESKIEHQAVANTVISQGSVGWHIEHSLLVINMIAEGLKRSEPSNYKWKFNIKRVIAYATGSFPRGSARAPKIVTPKEYDAESLKTHIQNTRVKLIELAALPADKYITHPFFDDIKTKDTIKFLVIHTNHHLKIINDILK